MPCLSLPLRIAAGGLFACAIALMPQPSAAQDKEDKVKLKLSPERVIAPLPDGWKVAYHVRDARKEIQEYVPAGETVENWTYMVTTKIYDRMTRGPLEYNTFTMNRFASLCTKSRKIVGPLEQRHGYPASLAFIECQTAPETLKKNRFTKKIEFRVQIAIKGKDALYVVESAWHSNDTSGPMPSGDPALLKSITSRLDKVFVCDDRLKKRSCDTMREAVLKN